MSFVTIHELKDEWKYLWFSTRTSFSKKLADYTVYTKHVLLNLAFHTASRAVKKNHRLALNCYPGFKMKVLKPVVNIYNYKETFH